MYRETLNEVSYFFLKLGFKCNNESDLVNTEKERNDLWAEAHAWWCLEEAITNLL